jgi:hypothetical protein
MLRLRQIFGDEKTPNDKETLPTTMSLIKFYNLNVFMQVMFLTATIKKIISLNE